MLLLVGSANRDERVFPDADRYDLDRDTLGSWSASASAATSAWAHRWPASRRASSSSELVARVGEYDVDPDGVRRVHSVNVRGFAHLPTDGGDAVSPKFEPARRPAGGGRDAGASSGIGAATALALAAAGHPVVLGARRMERCEEIAAEIRAAGGEAVAARLDVRDPASVKDFAAAAAELGDVDVLVSSAGDVLLHSSHGVDAAEFAAQVDLNLVGAQRLVSQFVPAMVERRRGDVVLITSDAVRLPRPLMSPTWRRSGASKAWPAPCRWNWRAPACGRRSCGRVRRSRAWARRGPPSSCNRRSTRGCSGDWPATATSSPPSTWPPPCWPRYRCRAAPMSR